MKMRCFSCRSADLEKKVFIHPDKACPDLIIQETWLVCPNCKDSAAEGFDIERDDRLRAIMLVREFILPHLGEGTMRWFRAVLHVSKSEYEGAIKLQDTDPKDFSYPPEHDPLVCWVCKAGIDEHIK